MIRGFAEYTLPSPARPDKARHDRLGGAEPRVIDYSVVGRNQAPADLSVVARRAPRMSVVVVLPENHVVSPDGLLNGLRACGDVEIDVVVACAGQPTNLGALQRCVRGAQFLLAPAGTSPEDLREMAMAQAQGDIVTLLPGALLREGAVPQPLFKTS
jgi:hypothetical protein